MACTSGTNDERTGGVYFWNKETGQTTAVGAPKPLPGQDVEQHAGGAGAFPGARGAPTSFGAGARAGAPCDPLAHSHSRAREGAHARRVASRRVALPQADARAPLRCLPGGMMVSYAAMGGGMALAMMTVRAVFGM